MHHVDHSDMESCNCEKNLKNHCHNYLDCSACNLDNLSAEKTEKNPKVIGTNLHI